jgi:hypothetical protein
MPLRIAELLELAARRSDCVVAPPRGVPAIRSGLMLPNDVVAFYQRCGGLAFPEGPLAVVGPELFIPTDEALTDPLNPDALTAGCYLVVEEDRDLDTGVRAGIDLHPERAGKCYELFWDAYGDSMDVIALSFTELVERILAFEGETIAYWLADDFEPYGDAYDDTVE